MDGNNDGNPLGGGNPLGDPLGGVNPLGDPLGGGNPLTGTVHLTFGADPSPTGAASFGGDIGGNIEGSSTRIVTFTSHSMSPTLANANGSPTNSLVGMVSGDLRNFSTSPLIGASIWGLVLLTLLKRAF